jgi:putative peptidoglycan lipid II flippase
MSNSDPRTGLARSTAAVALPTLGSRVLGWFRDVLLAYFLGTGDAADAFAIAFTIPNLFRRLTGEGALSASFVPVYAEARRSGDRDRPARLAGRVFSSAALALALLAVLGVVFAPQLVRVIAFGFRTLAGKTELTVAMTRVMFPYVLFVSLAALVSAALNAEGRFFVPAAHPIAFNLALIGAALLWAGRSSQPAFVFAAAVLAGGVLQLLVQLPALKRAGVRFKAGFSPRNPDAARVGRLLLPGILGVSVYQINFAVSRVIASGLESGSASALYYSSRVEELTLGLFSIALSVALLPHFSERAAAADLEGMGDTLGFSLKLTALVSVPAAAGLAALSGPVVRVLFERGVFDARSTELSSACLFYFALGLPFISAVKVIAPAFFSLKDARTPVLAGVAVMAANVVFCLWLAGPLRVAGVALALSLSQALNFAVLFVVIQSRVGSLARMAVGLVVLKAVFASLVMGLAVRAAYLWFEAGGRTPLFQAGLLVAVIAAGVLLYGLIMALAAPADARKLRALLAASFGRRKKEEDNRSLGEEP